MIEWNDSYLTGIDKIDKQHKELFRKVNMFIDSIAKRKSAYEVNETISFMRSYILNHFRDEEDIMERIQYPNKAEQEKAHDEFIDKHLDYILNTLGGHEAAVGSAIAFLENWLIRHVAEEDKKIGAHFAGLMNR